MKIASLKLHGLVEAICQEQKGFFKRMTKREKQVLKMIIEGHNSESMAQELGISINTVRTHRKNITKKTKLKTPKDIVLFALAFDML